MARFSITLNVNASLEDTFAIFADFEHAAGRVEGIKKIELLTPPPVGLGTKFKETRIMFKREASEVFTITAYEPNRRYKMAATSCGAEYHCDFLFTPEGSGTKVVVEFATRPISFMAKLMTPLSMMMMGTMKKCIRKDMDDLTRAAEAKATAV